MFKDRKESVALFGGSFDPPHFGHKAIVQEALRELEIDRLIIIPTFLNPFKEVSYTSADRRLLMSKNMFKEFLNVVVDDYEVRRAEPTPTAKTVKYFQQIYSVKYIIIGADNLNNIHQWFNFEWLNSQIVWVIATRVGYSLDTSKLREFKILEVKADISSTEIRKKDLKVNIDKRVERIVINLDKKKGDKIEVFNLEDVNYISQRVVIANSLGGKHSLALSKYLKDTLKPLGEEFLHIEESEDWVVIDMGDIIIHIMSPTYREKYSLEEFLSQLH